MHTVTTAHASRHANTPVGFVIRWEEWKNSNTRVPLVKGFRSCTELTDSNQASATSLGNESKLGVGGLGCEVGKQGVRNKVYSFVCSNFIPPIEIP